jgi:hypothetical protein
VGRASIADPVDRGTKVREEAQDVPLFMEISCAPQNIRVTLPVSRALAKSQQQRATLLFSSDKGQPNAGTIE